MSNLTEAQIKKVKMTSLTEAQIEEVKILIRLGDSLRLAIQTVLDKKDVDIEAYKRAYEA
jgi:hypothetical protein